MRTKTPTLILAGLLATGALSPPALTAQSEGSGPTPLLAPGDPALDLSRLGPGVDSVRYVMEVEGEPQPAQATLQVETRAFERNAGERVLVQVIETRNPRGRGVDTTVHRLPGLAPVRHRSHSPGHTLAVDYAEGRVDYRIVHRGRNEEGAPTGAAIEKSEVALDAPAFDPGVVSFMTRVLPLREGFEARIPLFDHQRRERVLATYRVTGSEAVETDGGWVPAWTVEVAIADGPEILQRVAKVDGRLLDGRMELGPGRVMRMRPDGS